MKEVKIKTRDERTIIVSCYEVTKPVASIVIVHGASEYIKRYEELALYLNKKNINVYGYDQLGHGVNLNKELNAIYFSDDDNAHIKLISDLEDVCLYVYTHNSSLPIFVFGHSMGSLVVRGLAIISRLNFNGLIICGTMNPSVKLLNSGLFLARSITKLRGKKKTSRFLNKLTFGKLEQKISYNKNNVANYHKDEYCGLLFTNEAITELLLLTKMVCNKANICLMSKTKYFFIGGADDKFSDDGKQVQEVIDYMKGNNFDVSFKFYPQARHEILKEDCKDEVMGDINEFIAANIKEK